MAGDIYPGLAARPYGKNKMPVLIVKQRQFQPAPAACQEGSCTCPGKSFGMHCVPRENKTMSNLIEATHEQNVEMAKLQHEHAVGLLKMNQAHNLAIIESRQKFLIDLTALFVPVLTAAGAGISAMNGRSHEATMARLDLEERRVAIQESNQAMAEARFDHEMGLVKDDEPQAPPA